MYLPVVIGFQQVHYKVEEGDGCVRVCVEVTAGQLRGGDGIRFGLVTLGLSASRRLIYRLILCFFMRTYDSCLHATILFFSEGEDYVRIPAGALLTIREGNMNRPQCKEIQIIDDTDIEGLEEFQVGIGSVFEEGVETSFDPIVTRVKIIDNDFPMPSPSPSPTPSQPPGTIMMTPLVPVMTPAPTPGGGKSKPKSNSNMYCFSSDF